MVSSTAACAVNDREFKDDSHALHDHIRVQTIYGIMIEMRVGHEPDVGSRVYQGGYMPVMSLRQGSMKIFTPRGETISKAILPWNLIVTSPVSRCRPP